MKKFGLPAKELPKFQLTALLDFNQFLPGLVPIYYSANPRFPAK